jgi:Bifunctional DNA primase/polymerase, N-terminal/Protein of unknown function (DUF3987)
MEFTSEQLADIQFAQQYAQKLVAPVAKAAELPFFQSIALPLAARGLKVIPVNGKDAFLDNHPQEATTDTHKITETWKKYAACNVAVHCLQEPGGVLIVDADQGNPLEMFASETGRPAPSTYVVQSSPGKFHIYFRQTPSTLKLQKNIKETETGGQFSLRLKNYYCVGEGSIHPTHHGRYTAISLAPIVDMPEDFLTWLLSKAKDSPLKKTAGELPTLKVPHGAIHPYLVEQAGRLRSMGLGVEDIESNLHKLADLNCEAPIDHDRVSQVARSFEKYEAGAPTIHLQMGSTPAVELAEENSGSRYAMTEAEYEAEMEKDYPVIPLTEQAGPTWDDSIMYGVCGDIIRKASAYCESHPAGMYLDLIVSIGNIIGRGPYFNITQTRHYTNEFMCRVGLTADSRKGTGRDVVDEILRAVDGPWHDSRIMGGFGSAEAIVNEMRDSREQKIMDKKTMTGFRSVVAPGVDDKRLCIREGEMASVFQLAGKRESRADIVLRDGWDGKPLRNLVKGKSKDGLSNSAVCMEPHLTISGDTTKAELIRKMPDGSADNGFGNRFLFCYVYRTKLCPLGGPPIDWSSEFTRLHEAISWAREIRYVPLTKSAEKVWGRMYTELDNPGNKLQGLAGAMTARSAAHIRRLALIFSLLDEMDVVETRHLHAAKKLWDYCLESARFIFEGSTREQLLIKRFLEQNGPATVPQIRRAVFHDNRKAEWVRAQVNGLIRDASSGVQTAGELVKLKGQ